MNKKKRLPEIEKQKIIDMLRCRVSINEIRNQTGYGVNILNRIKRENNIPYDAKQMQAGNNTLFVDTENVFIENSTSGNCRINAIIRTHNIIPHDKCWHCGLSEWIDGPLVLDLDHINGDNRDHRIENLRYLCPNCHSQTSTYKGKSINSGRQKVSDEILKRALKETKNIRQALIQVGLTPKGGNYTRAQKMLSSG